MLSIKLQAKISRAKRSIKKRLEIKTPILCLLGFHKWYSVYSLEHPVQRLICIRKGCSKEKHGVYDRSNKKLTFWG